MKKLLPFLVVMGIAVWSVWPVIENFPNAFAYGGDDALITWQLNQWGNNFQGNIFYPYKNTAAYHMLLVPSAIIGYWPVKITGSPVAAYNTTLILGQIMIAAVAYWWFKEMAHPSPKASEGAMVGAVVLILCQIRMGLDGVEIPAKREGVATVCCWRIFCCSVLGKYLSGVLGGDYCRNLAGTKNKAVTDNKKASINNYFRSIDIDITST
jgi:hypothetical protein